MSDDKLTTVEDNMKAILEKMATNRNDDYDYGRELLYATAERMQELADIAVDLARESEHPRAVEVASNTLNSMGDIAGKMMTHHMQTEKLNNPKGEKSNVTNNNVNVKLNTKDLLDLLGKE